MTFKSYIKARILEDLNVEVIAHPEEATVRGNASAIDDETDAQVEADIREQLDAGNMWAWCAVEVRGAWKGITYSDYLGCCSYKSERDFIGKHKDGSEYDSMVDEVAEKIADNVLEIVNKVLE